MCNNNFIIESIEIPRKFEKLFVDIFGNSTIINSENFIKLLNDYISSKTSNGCEAYHRNLDDNGVWKKYLEIPIGTKVLCYPCAFNGNSPLLGNPLSEGIITKRQKSDILNNNYDYCVKRTVKNSVNSSESFELNEWYEQSRIDVIDEDLISSELIYLFELFLRNILEKVTQKNFCNITIKYRK